PLFIVRTRPPPSSTLFPYTTLFRSDLLIGKTVREVQGPDRPEATLLIATGMHRCGPIHQVSGNLNPEILRQELLTEMVTGVSSADRKSTRLNSSHSQISYAVFCLKK